MNKRIDTKEVNTPAPLVKSEVEKLLEAYEKQNPEKYKIKKERGEFAKLLAAAQ